LPPGEAGALVGLAAGFAPLPSNAARPAAKRSTGMGWRVAVQGEEAGGRPGALGLTVSTACRANRKPGRLSSGGEGGIARV
jgi:hypothetical protein